MQPSSIGKDYTHSTPVTVLFLLNCGSNIHGILKSLIANQPHLQCSSEKISLRHVSSIRLIQKQQYSCMDLGA